MKTAAARATPPNVIPLAEARLDRVFAALADPVRRAILERLDGEELLVSELAAPFDISLQAVSKHIQVLVRAGLVRQERTGRVSRCSLVAIPMGSPESVASPFASVPEAPHCEPQKTRYTRGLPVVTPMPSTAPP